MIVISAVQRAIRNKFLLHKQPPSQGMSRILSIQGADETTVESAISECCKALRSGGVIAVPTETVYGVAAAVTSNESIEKLYALKGRQKDKPIAICLSAVSQLDRWCRRTVSMELLNNLLPGPVTVVFERSEELNPALNPGVSLVGARVPDYPFLQQLVASFGEPLALTSANISNTRSTLSIEEFKELWPCLDIIIDGGRISEDERPDSRKGSTVVNLSKPAMFSIIRKGMNYDETVRILQERYHLKEAN